MFGVHHLVRVMPGRKSSRSGRPRGRAFGKGSKRSGEEKRGDAASSSYPRGEAAWHVGAPMHPSQRRLQKGIGSILGNGSKKHWG